MQHQQSKPPKMLPDVMIILPVSIVSANFSNPSKGWKLSPISSVSFWLRHSLASCMLLVMKLDQYMGSMPDAGRKQPVVTH